MNITALVSYGEMAKHPSNNDHTMRLYEIQAKVVRDVLALLFKYISDYGFLSGLEEGYAATEYMNRADYPQLIEVKLVHFPTNTMLYLEEYAKKIDRTHSQSSWQGEGTVTEYQRNVAAKIITYAIESMTSKNYKKWAHTKYYRKGCQSQ